MFRRPLKVCLVVLAIGSVCVSIFAKDIVVYGDSQHNPEIQRTLVRTISSFKPAIVFRVGDIVDDGNDPQQWMDFKDIHRPLLTTTEYFPALGNHDRGSSLYFESFPFLRNRHWYSVDREGIHFIVLDSNSPLNPGSEQYQWLVSDLAGLGDPVEFVIAIFHHPLFDVGRDHGSDEKKLLPVLMPLFKEYGVSAVFSGHSHDYQRFEYDGMSFIVTGGGGSTLDDQGRAHPYLRKFSLRYHFCLLRKDRDSLRVKVIDIDSRVIDEFKIPVRINAHSVRR